MQSFIYTVQTMAKPSNNTNLNRSKLNWYLWFLSFFFSKALINSLYNYEQNNSEDNKDQLIEAFNASQSGWNRLIRYIAYRLLPLPEDLLRVGTSKKSRPTPITLNLDSGSLAQVEEEVEHGVENEPKNEPENKNQNQAENKAESKNGNGNKNEVDDEIKLEYSTDEADRLSAIDIDLVQSKIDSISLALNEFKLTQNDKEAIVNYAQSQPRHIDQFIKILNFYSAIDVNEYLTRPFNSDPNQPGKDIHAAISNAFEETVKAVKYKSKNVLYQIAFKSLHLQSDINERPLLDKSQWIILQLAYELGFTDEALVDKILSIPNDRFDILKAWNPRHDTEKCKGKLEVRSIIFYLFKADESDEIDIDRDSFMKVLDLCLDEKTNNLDVLTFILSLNDDRPIHNIMKQTRKNHLKPHAIRMLEQFIDKLDERKKSSGPNFKLSDQEAHSFVKLLYFLLVMPEAQLVRYNYRLLEKNEMLDRMMAYISMPEINAILSMSIDGKDNAVYRAMRQTDNPEWTYRILNNQDVYNKARKSNFYTEDTDTRLKEATERESAMRSMTKAESTAYKKIVERFKSKVENNINKTLDDFYKQVRKDYKASPVTVVFNEGEEPVKLPISWNHFQKLIEKKQWKANQIELAKQAYRKHTIHTVYRFLFGKPWEADLPEKPHQDKPLIDMYPEEVSYFYCAVFDTDPDSLEEGYTFESRKNHFYSSLAEMQRAHNWDKTREKKINGRVVLDKKGEPVRESYDDLGPDNQTCLLGFTGRLPSSLQGYSLFKPFTLEMLKSEQREFVRDHYATKVLTSKDQTQAADELLQAFYDSDNEDAQGFITKSEAFNFRLEDQVRFVNQLTDKYGGEIFRDPEVIGTIRQFFSLESGQAILGRPYYGHLEKFVANCDLYQLIQQKKKEFDSLEEPTYKGVQGKLRNGKLSEEKDARMPVSTLATDHVQLSAANESPEQESRNDETSDSHQASRQSSQPEWG